MIADSKKAARKSGLERGAARQRPRRWLMAALVGLMALGLSHNASAAPALCRIASDPAGDATGYRAGLPAPDGPLTSDDATDLRSLDVRNVGGGRGEFRLTLTDLPNVESGIGPRSYDIFFDNGGRHFVIRARVDQSSQSFRLVERAGASAEVAIGEARRLDGVVDRERNQLRVMVLWSQLKGPTDLTALSLVSAIDVGVPEATYHHISDQGSSSGRFTLKTCRP